MKFLQNSLNLTIFIQSLLAPPQLPGEETPQSPNSLPAHLPPQTAVANPTPATIRPAPDKAPDLKRLNALLLRAYTNVTNEDGWALVSRIEQYVRANHSELNPSNYGASTFFKLLGRLNTFQVAQRKQGNGHAQFCRPRQSLLAWSKRAVHRPPARPLAPRGRARRARPRGRVGGVAAGARVFSHPQCHHVPQIYDGIAGAEAEDLLKGFFAEKR